MSNIERAAEVLRQADRDMACAGSRYCYPSESAQALADAGLLAPDLPHPDRSNGTLTDWGDEGAMPEASVKKDGTLFVYDDGRMRQEDPAEIRRTGLVYLAAAAWAEQQ